MCPFINKQIIAAADSGSLPALLSVIDENLQAMNLVNLTTALHRLAKLPPNSFCGTSGPGAALLDQLIDATKSSLSKTMALAQDIATSSRCQTISNIAWSAATLGCNDFELLAIIVQYVNVQLQHFEHFELSSMLWSLSTLSSRNPSSSLLVAPIFNKAANLIVQEVDQFKANFLVMIVWAFANAKIFDQRVFVAVAPTITLKMQRGQLSARQLSSLARSFSDAGYLERDLFDQIAQRSASKLHSFEEQELVDLAVGVACASITEWAFFSQVAKSALSRSMSPVNLGILMHAISMVRPRHPGLAAALLALLERSPEPVEGLASAGARDAVVVAVFESVGILHNWELEQLPNASSSLTQRMSVALPSARVLKFLDNAQNTLVGSLQMMADESLPQVLRAFGALSEDRPKIQWARLFDAIAAESARRCTTLESSLLLTLAQDLRQAPGAASAVVPLLLAEVCLRSRCRPANDQDTSGFGHDEVGNRSNEIGFLPSTGPVC